MRICIVGGGAIGGLVAAGLSDCGVRTTIIDRGPRLAQLRADGVTVADPDGGVRTTKDITVWGSCADAGAHDLVILAVKAQVLPRLAGELPHLFHGNTVVLTLQNGIPWWYFQRHGGDLDGTRIPSLDPEGELARAVDPRRIMGCVAYPAAEMDGEGVIRHVEGNRFAIGELDGELTDRLAAVAERLTCGPLRFRPIRDIRAEIWLKALGSVSLNPVSALTGATMAGMLQAPEGRSVIRSLMEEAAAVAGALGVTLRRTVEERMAGAERVGAHRTSMLQDLERGEPLEIDALVTAIREMGAMVGRPTPAIEAVEGCLRLLQGTREAGRAPTREEEEVLIRPMVEEDVPACMAILDSWQMAPTPEREDAERSGILVENAFVAVHRGRIVGTAGWFPLCQEVAETASLAVDRSCRGLGVGRLLQEARLTAMRERGFKRVRTETDRPETIRWYKEKFGYREVGRNPKKHPFSLPDVDEWTVLELEL